MRYCVCWDFINSQQKHNAIGYTDTNNNHNTDNNTNAITGNKITTIADMKQYIIENVNDCFKSVYDGYYLASLSGCERLLTKSQRHIYLFLQLCEWAEGDKSLSAYGIKNNYTKRKNIINSDSTYSNVASRLRLVSFENFDFAVDCYVNAVNKLRKSISFRQSNKLVLENTKLCLASLQHIKELLLLGEIKQDNIQVESNNAGGIPKKTELPDSKNSDRETNVRKTVGSAKPTRGTSGGTAPCIKPDNRILVAGSCDTESSDCGVGDSIGTAPCIKINNNYIFGFNSLHKQERLNFGSDIDFHNKKLE